MDSCVYYRGIPLYTEYIAGSPELWPLVCQQDTSVCLNPDWVQACYSYVHTYLRICTRITEHPSAQRYRWVSERVSDSCLTGLASQIPNPMCLCDHPCPPYTYCVCSREDARQLISKNVPIQYVEILISSIACGSGYIANCTKGSVRPFYVSMRFNYR